MNEIYYSICPNGNIVSSIEKNTFYDDNCWKFGNYYNTVKEAEFAKQKQLVYQKLKKYALEHNTEEIDWTDNCSSKFYITYGYQNNELFIYSVRTVKSPNTVYFTSKKIAENAIKDIGEDRIKKYLFEID